MPEYLNELNKMVAFDGYLEGWKVLLDINTLNCGYFIKIKKK